MRIALKASNFRVRSRFKRPQAAFQEIRHGFDGDGRRSRGGRVVHKNSCTQPVSSDPEPVERARGEVRRLLPREPRHGLLVRTNMAQPGRQCRDRCAGSQARAYARIGRCWYRSSSNASRSRGVSSIDAAGRASIPLRRAARRFQAPEKICPAISRGSGTDRQDVGLPHHLRIGVRTRSSQLAA